MKRNISALVYMYLYSMMCVYVTNEYLLNFINVFEIHKRIKILIFSNNF